MRPPTLLVPSCARRRPAAADVRPGPARIVRWCLVTVTAVVVLIGGASAPAWAHNALESSEPGDGAVVDVAPTQMSWTFLKPVPLDTLTVTHIDPAGVRATLDGSTHGPLGEQQVVTPLPALVPGVHSLRWRLVGADGHAVTGRVDVTVAANDTAGTTAVTADTAPAPPTTMGTDTGPGFDDETTSGIGDAGRWALRYGSYLAIMIVVGVLVAESFAWRSGAMVGLLRRVVRGALLMTVVIASGKLVALAADIRGDSWWASLDALGTAADTDVGIALVLRILIAAAVMALIGEGHPRHEDTYWTTVTLLAAALLATWSFAGHARTMRWPWLGVPLDVLHHGAAAAWLGGLVVVGVVAAPRLSPAEFAGTVAGFSRMAAVAVAIIVSTGAVQALRLVGSPGDMFATAHGRLLLAKITGLGVMLLLAEGNRRRVQRTTRPALSLSAAGRPLGRDDVRSLQRAMAAECVVGLLIVGITAALVVSTPGVGG